MLTHEPTLKDKLDGQAAEAKTPAQEAITASETNQPEPSTTAPVEPQIGAETTAEQIEVTEPTESTDTEKVAEETDHTTDE